MKMMTPIATSVALLLSSLCLRAGEQDPAALPRSTPEDQGIASSAILGFIEEAEAKVDALHSFMLLRHGRVVAEGWWAPYGPQTVHELYSLSKSFTSTAVGLAVSEGRFSIDDTVLSFFPEDAPEAPSANLKSMRVRDLLCMSTGHQVEPSTAPDQVSAKSFLAQPVPFKPGTHFLYNTAATFMQSAIVQKATGQTVFDYLQTRLFKPLGIVNAIWQTNFQGISLGGYGLSVRTEDIARFGQLYLNKGQWGGKQLVPAAWIEAATSRQTSNGSNPQSDWDQGYGFQFWRCRHNSYRGDGAFGQYCIVMPEQDAVIAITSGVKDMQAVLNLVWDKLLPAMHDKKLDADTDVQNKLQAKLASLKLPAQAGSAAPSSLASKISGRTYSFPTNSLRLDSISLNLDQDNNVILATRVNGQEQKLAYGYGEWKKGRVALGNAGERAVAVSGAWAADDTYMSKICFYETPYIITMKLKFNGDNLLLDSEYNVSFGPARLPQLVGSASATAQKIIKQAAPPEPEGMTKIFNGQDLSDWDGDPRLWSVKDGSIRGETTLENAARGNTFIIWKGGKVKDFDLRLSFRCNAANNSGIQYRSKRKLYKETDANKWGVTGYQAEVRNEVTLPNVSGFIYDEGGKRGRLCLVGEKAIWENGQKRVLGTLCDQEDFKDAFRLDDWNDYIIIARGNSIQHYLNGLQVVDFTDNQSELALKEGIIALQLHAGKPMWCEFRNIRVKSLDGGE